MEDTQPQKKKEKKRKFNERRSLLEIKRLKRYNDQMQYIKILAGSQRKKQ